MASGAEGASAVSETKLRDGVKKDPIALGFDERMNELATQEGTDRFDTKVRDGVVDPHAKIAEPRREVIIGGSQTGDVADTRRDVTGNGGFADGLADGRIDDVEQPASADMFEVGLDDAVQANANKDDIRRKARAAK